MNTPPPDAPPLAPPSAPPSPDAGPRVSRDEVRDLGRLRRVVGPDRKVAGVAGGLARHLDIDPVILRVAFVVLAFFGGAGVLVYAACWLLVPEEGHDRAAIGLDERNRSIALTVVAGIAVLALLGDSVGQWGFPWPLVVIGVVALFVLTLVDRNRERPHVTAPPVPHDVDPVTGQLRPLVPVAPVGPPAAPWRPPPPPVRLSRRRGPILFWFTMALSALGVGALGVADLAGADVVPSAYPAVVVGACGLMLLVGAFYGRPGGLVLIGLVASLAMALAAVVGPWHGAGSELHRPATAAAVRDSYRLTFGEQRLDLTHVADPAALDGRTIELTGRAGRIEVTVPPGLAVTVNGRVTGAGHLTLFGNIWDGRDVRGSATRPADPGSPALTIDARLFAGEIDVHSAKSETTTTVTR